MPRIRSMIQWTWRRSQGAAVFALCFGAAMVLPISLTVGGFHSL